MGMLCNVPKNRRDRLFFDSILIIGLAVNPHSGLSNGSLKASLAAVIDQCRVRLQEWREGKMRRRGRGRERERQQGWDEGRGPQCPCLSNLLHTVYLEKPCPTTKIEGPLSPRTKGKWRGSMRQGGVALYKRNIKFKWMWRQCPLFSSICSLWFQ